MNGPKIQIVSTFNFLDFIVTINYGYIFIFFFIVLLSTYKKWLPESAHAEAMLMWPPL